MHSKLVKKWGKKCSTGQRFICTEVTSYKIHSLLEFFLCRKAAQVTQEGICKGKFLLISFSSVVFFKSPLVDADLTRSEEGRGIWWVLTGMRSRKPLRKTLVFYQHIFPWVSLNLKSTPSSQSGLRKKNLQLWSFILYILILAHNIQQPNLTKPNLTLILPNSNLIQHQTVFADHSPSGYSLNSVCWT